MLGRALRIHSCGGEREVGFGCPAVTTKPDPRGSGAEMTQQNSGLGWGLGMQDAHREGVCHWQGSFLQLRMFLGNCGMNASVQKWVSGWHHWYPSTRMNFILMVILSRHSFYFL